jgi:hypothetical protein
MSVIRVDNFGPSSGGTTYSARGIAKAWVNFNGTGTIASRDSENVSSLTDNGTGNYDVNFTSSFAATDYSGVASTNIGTDSGVLCAAGSASSFDVLTFDAGSNVDVSVCTCSNHGDLA